MFWSCSLITASAVYTMFPNYGHADPRPGQPMLKATHRPRYCCGTVTLTRVALAAADVAYFAWVHDISESGIGLDVLAPMATGVDLVFELKRGAGNDKLRVNAQVIHATAVGPFYRVGCKFTCRCGVRCGAILQQSTRRR